MTRDGFHTVSIATDHYDRTLPHCDVCGARVDTMPGRLAERHGRLVEVAGRGIAQSTPCPGSLTPIAEARQRKEQP